MVSLSNFASLRGLTAAAGVVALVAWGGVQTTGAQSSLRAEQSVDYRVGRAVTLNTQVGPVKVSSVEFTDLGRGYGRGGIAGRLRPAGSSEASTTLRAHFLAENPQSDEWEVTFTLEFLDRSGKVIERATRRSSWEGEAKAYDFDHEILEYVVPLIAKVQIKLEGKLD